jgi:anti-anti-sigma factor
VTSKIDSGVAHLTLSGRLDANTAPTFKTEIEKVAAGKPQTLVLFVEKLEYMASAGIRMLVFTKQVRANDQIINTLEMTGADKSVIFVDEFQPAALVR